MAGRPTLGNSKFQMEGIRTSDGQPMELKASCWINPAKDDKFNQEKIAICEQINKLILDHNIGFRIQLEHINSADYNSWPTLGYYNLFSNKPRDQQSQQQTQQPPAGGFGGGFGNG